MFKYIMILVFGLSLFLPVAVQAGTGPAPTVAVIKCCMDLQGACITETDCAVCIQSILDFGLNLEQTNVEDSCSWYHFFEDRKDSFR